MPPKAAAAEPEPEPEPEPEEPQEGVSAFTFTDGSKYEGAWVIKEGKKLRHGHGVFIDGAAKGQTYEGEWADDAMAGRGAFRYATSAKYEGEFLNNQYQGHGTYTFPSGAVYDGPFVENQMHGEGTYTDEHGVQWKGTFYMGSGPGLPGHASAQAS